MDSSEPLQLVSVIVLLKSKNKFLLVKRSENDDIFPGKWQNLGGKIEVGECVEDAIVREVKEETGLKISENILFIQSYSWKKNETSPTRLGLIFLIELTGSYEKYKVVLCEELTGYGWFTLSDIKRMEDKDMLIGKDRPKGTFGQIKVAVKINY